jgi:hypothetical protein
METYLAAHDSEIIKPYWIIAVTRISHSEEARHIPPEWPSFDPTIPPSVLTEWKLVGFDITDRGGEAHLTGVEFRGDQKYIDSICKQWGPKLNEYHLFRKLDDALEYKEFETESVPEQSPYYVYGIWLIREVKK